MELSKDIASHHTYNSLGEKESLRFDLFDWLKAKELTARQAIDLLLLTRDEIVEARRGDIDSIKL